jgi:hypothetical protein
LRAGGKAPEGIMVDTMAILLNTKKRGWRKQPGQGKAQSRKFEVTGGHHGFQSI